MGACSLWPRHCPSCTLELRKRRVAKAKAAAPADGPEDAVADVGGAKLEDSEELFSLFDWAEARSQLGGACHFVSWELLVASTASFQLQPAAYQVDFLQECWDALPNRSS